MPMPSIDPVRAELSSHQDVRDLGAALVVITFPLQPEWRSRAIAYLGHRPAGGPTSRVRLLPVLKVGHAMTALFRKFLITTRSMQSVRTSQTVSSLPRASGGAAAHDESPRAVARPQGPAHRQTDPSFLAIHDAPKWRLE